MLLDPHDWSLASRIDDVLAGALAHGRRPGVGRDARLGARAGQPAASHRGAAPPRSSRGCAPGLAADLAPLDLRAAVAGTHPFAQWSDVEVSPGARYQSIYDSMRELARREPTFALHVHVAMPDAESAVRALRGMRVHVPLLLALSANSPFWQGRDTGLASARVPVFGTFPRVGIPRPFANYAEYVEAIDVLLRSGAFPEPTFLWWDVRLQPRFGTIEVRIMDAQTRASDNAALAALVQCAVRLEATEGFVAASIAGTPEVLDENRFLATRDGMRARVPRPRARRRAGPPRRSSTSCSPPARRTPPSWAARQSWPRPPPCSPPSRATIASGMLAGVAQGETIGPGLGDAGERARRRLHGGAGAAGRAGLTGRGQRVSRTARRASTSCGLLRVAPQVGEPHPQRGGPGPARRGRARG